MRFTKLWQPPRCCQICWRNLWGFAPRQSYWHWHVNSAAHTESNYSHIFAKQITLRHVRPTSKWNNDSNIAATVSTVTITVPLTYTSIYSNVSSHHFFSTASSNTTNITSSNRVVIEVLPTPPVVFLWWIPGVFGRLDRDSPLVLSCAKVYWRCVKV